MASTRRGEVRRQRSGEGGREKCLGIDEAVGRELVLAQPVLLGV